MGAYIGLENYTTLFNNNERVPLVVNDLPSITEDDKKRINQIISTEYKDTDLFSNEPSCECGEVKSGYNLGLVCRNCNTSVSELFDK
jgi:hypothetical protein